MRRGMETSGREDRASNDLFFACCTVEYIGRQTRNRREDVVDALGRERLERIIEYANVLHSENVAAVAERLVEEAGIKEGCFDNVANARYGTPTHWDIGKVYKRLALGIMRERGVCAVDALIEAFHSPIATLINDYNGSFFYEAPANVLTAHLTGAVEE